MMFIKQSQRRDKFWQIKYPNQERVTAIPQSSKNYSLHPLFIRQKWYRDAKILELYEGTKEAEIMTIGRVLMSK